jgi:hypothetical protein
MALRKRFVQIATTWSPHIKWIMDFEMAFQSDGIPDFNRLLKEVLGLELAGNRRLQSDNSLQKRGFFSDHLY